MINQYRLLQGPLQFEQLICLTSLQAVCSFSLYNEEIKRTSLNSAEVVSVRFVGKNRELGSDKIIMQC